MTTTITDVTELQAMEDDLTEDYVLGNNIDASATSGWNGGEGFDPIGSGITLYSYSRPESDDVGYAGQGGSWTIYPADGVYYDKVDEETSDDDTTYIKANTAGTWCLLSHDALGLDIPDDATDISVRIYANVRNEASGVAYIQGMLNIDGTEYLVGNNRSITSQSYALKQWTMNDYPPDSSEWTPLSVFSLAVQGVGVKVSDAYPDVIITQIYIRVSYKRKFSGTFDGAGYTISDLYINRPTEDYIGLFGYAEDSTIQDVILTDATMVGVDSVGTLIGEAVDTFTPDITATGVTVTSSGNDVGGLMGLARACTISECFISGSVSGDYQVAGLAGACYSSDVDRCYTTASATGGNIGTFVGGLIGLGYRNDIDNCYARGDVDGKRYIGGLIGYSYDSSETVDDSYSTGVVTGNDDVGGLMGYSTSTVSNCFWDTQTSGQASSAAGTGKTTVQMKALSTFIASTWNIGGSGVDRNDGYPFLHWETGGSVPIWQIYLTGERCFTIPDLVDHKGRCPKGARVRAYRVDTHELVTTGYLDKYCNATLCGLPLDVDIVFHVTWGGPRTPREFITERRVS